MSELSKRDSGVSNINAATLENVLHIDARLLDEQKEQTAKKIEYVTNYVEEWLYVWSNESHIHSISFIDSMTNAGIYKNGVFGTAVEVYKLFCVFAKNNPTIKYKLFINDINKERIVICKKVLNYICSSKPSNLEVIEANKDVNRFLQEEANSGIIPRGYGNAVLLFVDPYDARTVHLNSVRSFVESRYCEVLFNWFSSDYTRNKKMENYEAIRDCFDGLEITNEEDPAEAISSALKVGDIKYVFSYPFRISTNIELYQIVFLTPNSKGLEKLKDALWKTFKGAEYHRNKSKNKIGQTSMFDLEEGKNLLADIYSEDARRKLLVAFRGKMNVSYEELVVFIMERTMLRRNHVLTYVVKPLIADGKLKKDGRVNNKTFIKDTYSFE